MAKNGKQSKTQPWLGKKNFSALLMKKHKTGLNMKSKQESSIKKKGFY